MCFFVVSTLQTTTATTQITYQLTLPRLNIRLNNLPKFFFPSYHYYGGGRCCGFATINQRMDPASALYFYKSCKLSSIGPLPRNMRAPHIGKRFDFSCHPKCRDGSVTHSPRSYSILARLAAGTRPGWRCAPRGILTWLAESRVKTNSNRNHSKVPKLRNLFTNIIN